LLNKLSGTGVKDSIKSKLLKLSIGALTMVRNCAERSVGLMVGAGNVSLREKSKLASEYRPVHIGTTVTSYKETRKCLAPNVDGLQQHYVGDIPFSEAAPLTSTIS
jgi:hypothetical protein